VPFITGQAAFSVVTRRGGAEKGAVLLGQHLDFVQILATEAADPAENLPDGAAICVAVSIAREKKHLADLLIRICLARTN